MAHPGSIANHEANRKKVCVTCGIKVKSPRSLSNNIRASIEKFYPFFNINDSRFPTSICVTCRLTISKVAKDSTLSSTLPEMPNYQDMVLLKDTRNSPKDIALCYCFICLKGRSKAHTPPKSGRGKTRKLDPKICKGLFAAKEDAPIAPETSTQTPIPVIKTCGVCLQSIGKGVRHDCKANSASANIVRTLETLPDKVSEQVASAILCSKASMASGSAQNTSLSLVSKGKPTRVLINPSTSSQPVISHEDLDNLQAGVGNLSNTKMRGVANWCRTTFGRKCVEVGYKEHLTDKSTHLKDLYQLQYENLEVDRSGTSKQRPIVYANAKNIVERVCAERDYESTPNVIITIDGGGGFFKVCASILPQDYNWDNVPETNRFSGENPQPTTSTRSSYVEGGTMKQGKLSGVKRLITLALVPDIIESNRNFRLIFDLIKLNDINYRIVSDYKAMLITLGLQTSRSSFPCPHCLIPLRDFDDYFTKADEYQLRTFGILHQDHKKFTEELKSNYKLAKHCHSTVNASLVVEEPSVTVLETYILPELHSILGFVNHIFFDGLCPLLTKEKALIWPMNLHLIPKGYHGSIFEGNQCRALIAKAEFLRDPEILGAIQSEPDKADAKAKVDLYIDCIKSFDKVVNASFSSRPVDISKVECLVEDFKQAYKLTGISVTPKVHGVFDHLVPTLKLPYMQGLGLGVCTEQAGESFHFHFKEYFWKKWKISSMDHPDFGKHLLAAVVECASKAV